MGEGAVLFIDIVDIHDNDGGAVNPLFVQNLEFGSRFGASNSDSRGSL